MCIKSSIERSIGLKRYELVFAAFKTSGPLTHFAFGLDRSLIVFVADVGVSFCVIKRSERKRKFYKKSVNQIICRTLDIMSITTVLKQIN